MGETLRQETTKMTGKDWLKLVGGIVLIAVMVMFFLGFRISIGRCIVSENDYYMVVLDGSPVVISRDSERFEDMETGDNLLVVHDMIAASYPGQSGALFVMKIGSGDIDDVPSQVLEELAELGWEIIE